MFYDSDKTAEENAETNRKHRHNRDALQFITAGIVIITATITLAVTAGKAIKDHMR